MRKLPDDLGKRRVQLIKRLFQHLDHFQELMESGQMEFPGIVRLPDGEEIYLADLMVGIESLPPRQREAFELICRQGYTETDATKIMLPDSRWSTPCFSGDTEFMTSKGITTLREVVNTEQKVVGKWGTWTDASIKSFGQQQLYELTIDRRRLHKIYVTAEHRWICSDLTENTTLNLLHGQELATIQGRNWRVVSVEPTGRVEEVFCAVVPDGEAFVLTYGLLTGNCQQYADSALARMISSYDEYQETGKIPEPYVDRRRKVKSGQASSSSS